MIIKIIEKGSWGNTLVEAASNYIAHIAYNSQSVAEVAELLEKAIPAELPGAAEALVRKLSNLASVSGDVLQLMMALPPMAGIARYGNVRKSDLGMVERLIEGMLVRITIGLPLACYGLDDEAAGELVERISAVHQAIYLMQNTEHTSRWLDTLLYISGRENVHGLVSGKVLRLLNDAQAIAVADMQAAFSRALSAGNEPAWSAAWLEGFLKESGMILLLDDMLWDLLDGWIKQLDADTFINLLPLLRRNFSTFNTAERRKLGEKAKAGRSAGHIPGEANSVQHINHERGMKAAKLVLQLLGGNK